MLFRTITLYGWIFVLFLSAGCFAIPWASKDLEALDEINDAEIYRAVLNSVNEWKRKQEIRKRNNRIKRQDATSVCYPEVGCFETSGPFGYLDMLPSKPEEIDTKFLMYPGHSKRRSGSPPAEIPFANLADAFKWANQGFNKSLPTKVLIHGFGSGCSHIWVYEMRSALMAVEEINVICVDWENGAILPNYVKATANTRLVGKQLAMLLQGLVANNGLSLRKTHLIGFSLGAHVAGFAGAEIGNLSRITGLDPAGPLFESQDPRARLDQTDAEFVDVIHSNGENLILGGLGSYQPMGHVDFYPNGGRMQKGCSNLFVGAVSDIIWSSAVEGRSLCNHRRAYKFFTDSVSPRCHFPAFPCDSYEDFLAGKCFPCTDERKCGNMGYYADRSKGRGQLYLITRDEEPFCAHQYLVKIETSPSAVNIVSYGKIQVTLIGDSLLNETFMMTRKEDEEMVLGQSISRILVPHPILAEPNQIQILYTAYSGWLSSGLTQWRMDKVTLMDSFGKTSSVCKKNLVLDSGVPVTLPLYPGECNLPKDVQKEAQNRIHDPTSNRTYKEVDSTPVVEVGDDHAPTDYKKYFSLGDAIEALNIPWNDKESNLIESEAESSRAFNTRIVKNRDRVETDADVIKEIVEPILKPHSSKNARSHDPDRQKAEITEPILGPTNSKVRKLPKIETTTKNNFIFNFPNQNKELYYNFYDYNEKSTTNNYLDKKRGVEFDNYDNVAAADNPLEAIVTTVQFLPQRLARMFEQAEKYARETILPLVSTYTPKFITDIIAPPKQEIKYVPLYYDQNVPVPSKNSRSVKSKAQLLKSKKFEPPKDVDMRPLQTDERVTTPYTHIQKIGRRGDNIEFVFPQNTLSLLNETKRKTRENAVEARFMTNNYENGVKNREGDDKIRNKRPSKAIYIDLPVFDVKTDKTKYIPLHFEREKN